jgi:UDP-N-acetylglucosamine 4,6-dehydratase
MRYLITGSGTLGSALAERLYKNHEVIVYSNDEYGQSELARHLNHPNITYWLGDVRDLERLKDACDGVDIIIHTAAQKRMDTASQNAFEVADVNIKGMYNVCLAGKSKKIIFVSTDKAFNPTCIYGASKMIAEGIALAHKCIIWRFGNFINSRGSVWEVFKDQLAKNEPFTITNPNATRFVIEVDKVCDYVLSDVKPGIHYPKRLRSMTVREIANSIDPNHECKIVGLREGEKMHESFNDKYSSGK